MCIFFFHFHSDSKERTKSKCPSKKIIIEFVIYGKYTYDPLMGVLVHRYVSYPEFHKFRMNF